MENSQHINNILKQNSNINNNQCKDFDVIENQTELLFIQKGVLLCLNENTPLFICKEIVQSENIFPDVPYINIDAPGVYKIQLIINIPKENKITTTIYIKQNNSIVEGSDIKINKQKTCENSCYVVTAIFRVTSPSSISAVSTKKIEILSPDCNETLASISIKKIGT